MLDPPRSRSEPIYSAQCWVVFLSMGARRGTPSTTGGCGGHVRARLSVRSQASNVDPGRLRMVKATHSSPTLPSPCSDAFTSVGPPSGLSAPQRIPSMLSQNPGSFGGSIDRV